MAEYDVHNGDCVEVLRGLPDDHFDSIVTDPPYGIGFMGKSWDKFTPSAYQDWSRECAEEFKRVLKPGGHYLSFTGRTTYHRHVSGIEDAGFEIRDMLLWLFSERAAKGSWLNGDRTVHASLKPMYEPVVIARNAYSCSASRCFRLNKTGGLNVDACRSGNELKWPADVVVDEETARVVGYPSRFMFTPRISKSERESGCEHLPKERKGTGETRQTVRSNTHPTVKPIALMRWLVRLATPVGGTVLDPFAGSGSTGVACVHEGRSFVGVEREHKYVDIANARIAHALNTGGTK